jgi:outer membrane biosynthesis protein TonB
MRRRIPNHTGLALAGTLLVHGASGAFLFATAGEGPKKQPPTYKVRLVAAPEPDPNARPAPDAVDRPAEAPAPAPSAKKPPPRSTIAKAAPPQEDAKLREAAPRSTPKVAPAPGVKPSTGSDVATVSTEGVDFPFPEYIRNVTSQILLRWDRPQTALEAEVAFFVQRDGSVRENDIKLVKRSGNFAFDLEAVGAIEEAGRTRAFGPLPDGWQSEVLYIRFYFSWREQ